ncbi:MAG: stress-induced protein OsmC [Bacteroidia bacterium]|nr:MAG: stress-induced protein OsmC [Bacteroidia bacterium]
METIRLEYKGQLRVHAEHVKSGITTHTDAPTDNQGKGESFSPTDLLCTALGSCMLTIMGISANTHNFSIDGTKVKVTKIMKSDPRRVGEVIVEFDMPNIDYSEKQKEILRLSAENCPVAKSLHPDLIQTIIFNYNK